MTEVTMALRHMGGTLKRCDRVVLTALGIIAALALTVPAQAGASLSFTLGALTSIAPFLTFSVVIAATAKATGADRQIANVFKGRQAIMITAAASFGALSPFCSCGVIPIVAGLLAAGVPVAPVMAFWISSPLMSPEMFILTIAVFDLPFATARALAAIFMGLGAGFATQVLARRPAFAQPLKAGRGGAGGCQTPALAPASGTVWAFWRQPERRKIFSGEALISGGFLFKWLTLAFIVESLMLAYLPADTVSEWLGSDRWWVVPASVAVGVPAYLNGYAAIPTVAALVNMGMGLGAALAFMVAGGVTSIPAAMAVFALVKRPVFLWYLALGLAGSLIVGFAYQAVLGL
ncbi:MAG: permease [Proteobacteria bacterium]|nr:permease [Pseudomonadota bacterium]